MKNGEPKSGKIYVVTNDCFKKVRAWGRYAKYGEVAPVKIGRAKDVENRIGSLSSGVPDDFVKHLVLHVENYVKFEHILQTTMFEEYRIYTRRSHSKTEFFAVPIKEAMDIIKTLVEAYPDKFKIERDYGVSGKSDGRSGSAQKRNRKLAEEQTKKSKQGASAKPVKVSKRRSSFKFSMCGIKPGEKVAFVNDASKLAEVVDDRHVMYDGKKFSLTALAKRLLNTKWSLAGTLYFTYKGEVLDDLRKRLEK